MAGPLTHVALDYLNDFLPFLAGFAIALATAYVADRLTRPLRDVADAARRLGIGETTARATGGDDRESADLADAFNAMAERLERSETLRRRAASDIAHDLATPATVLVSQLQAMVDGVMPADRDGLEAARSSASALGSVVAELNDLASAEAAPLQTRPITVDLGAAVHRLHHLRQHLDGGLAVVELAPAVVRDVNRVGAVLQSFDLAPRNVEIALSLFLGTDKRAQEAGRSVPPAAMHPVLSTIQLSSISAGPPVTITPPPSPGPPPPLIVKPRSTGVSPAPLLPRMRRS